MLSYARIERIGFNRVVAALKPEVVTTHDQVHERRHAADAAVTLRRFDIGRCVDFEPDLAAMTTASVYCHDVLRGVVRLHTASKLFAGMA